MNLDPESASSLRLRIVDLSAPGAVESGPTGPLVAVGSTEDIISAAAQPWLDRATFTLTQDEVPDRRVISVPSVDAAVSELVERIDHWPQAASVCDDVVRSLRPDEP